MLETPFYDPNKSYEENFEEGPFGAFSDGRRFQRSVEPEAEFLGVKVWQPFGIPAGPLLNGEFVAAAFAMGFDVNVFKTVRTREYGCHPWPNVLGVEVAGKLSFRKAQGKLVARNKYKQPLSITNSFGVPSPDPDFWQEDMAKAVKAVGKGQVMVGSFQGTKKEGGNAGDLIADYVLGAKLVKEAGARILEANLSCPNEGTADLLCFDTARVVEIATRIKDEIGETPLLLKLAYFKDQEHLRDYVKRVGKIADGFSVINTIAAEIVDEGGKQALPGEGRLRSGVCGAAIKWAGLEMVERIVKLRDEFDLDLTVVGVGGVTVAGDYGEYRRAGADCVMSATGAMWNPYLAQEIWELTEGRK